MCTRYHTFPIVFSDDFVKHSWINNIKKYRTRDQALYNLNAMRLNKRPCDVGKVQRSALDCRIAIDHQINNQISLRIAIAMFLIITSVETRSLLLGDDSLISFLTARTWISLTNE